MSTSEKIDITEEAQKILSCIRRMDERFGVTMTAKVLRGSKDRKVRSFNFDKLSTYSLLNNYTEREIVDLINFLIAENNITITESQYPTLRLNERSVAILKGEKTVYMSVTSVPTEQETNFHHDLFEKLRKLRMDIAKEKNIPPYVVFPDSTLKDIARYLPETKQDMLMIKGIGDKRYEQFGETFLQVVLDWKSEHPEAKERVLIHQSQPNRIKTKQSTEPSYLQSYKLFQSGKPIKTIAEMRDMTEQTVTNHLFQAYEKGHPIAWNIFFNEEEENEILNVANSITEIRLNPIKELLPDEYCYTKIKAVLVKNGM